MDRNLVALKPALVWKHFAEIVRIPRPSSHEEKIRRYILDFARAQGLESKEDAAHNVYVRKPASKGMEDRKGVILQAHLDMVPQKNNDKEFDFTKDPIDAYIDGGWVTADGTTLGADNGIGVAAILAVLEDRTLKHGPLEALFTATEETGMDGANGLEKGLLHGDILLNLDSEEEGELYVGCAGGLDANMTFGYKAEPTPAGGYTAAKISVKGLKGGHSGIQIVCQRANANKVLFRFLNAAPCDVLLASVDGGGLRNAIPREAEAVVLVETRDYDEFAAAVKAYEETVRAEYAGIEDAVSVKIAEVGKPAEMLPKEVAGNLIKAVAACPDGVQRMSVAMPGLVQTSTNLARVVSDGRTVKLQCLLRSSVHRRPLHAGRGQNGTHGRLQRLEPRHGVADPEGHDRLLRGAVREEARRDGHSRRAGVRHHRQRLSRAGHDFVRPDDLLPPLARREGGDRLGREVLRLPGRHAAQRSRKIIAAWRPIPENGSSSSIPWPEAVAGLTIFHRFRNTCAMPTSSANRSSRSTSSTPRNSPSRPCAKATAGSSSWAATGRCTRW